MTPYIPVACYNEPVYFYNMVNEYRIDNNKESLKIDQQLCEYAADRAEDAITDWSHNGFFNKNHKYWYRFIELGENLGSIDESNKIDITHIDAMNDVMGAWKASKLHNDNLLDPRYDHHCVVCTYYTCAHIFGQLQDAKR